nr:HEAT repeat domain-containing protein [Candidatus Sigynarchaeota archaeon]
MSEETLARIEKIRSEITEKVGDIKAIEKQAGFLFSSQKSTSQDLIKELNRKYPSNYVLWILLGSFQIRDGFPKRAVQAYENALRSIGAPEDNALSAVSNYGSSPHTNIATALKCKLSVAHLISTLNSNDRSISVIKTLETLQDPAALPALVDSLKDEKVKIRKVAARAVGHVLHAIDAQKFMDPVDVVAALQIALNDSDKEVRRTAARALGDIKRDLDHTFHCCNAISIENSLVFADLVKALTSTEDDIFFEDTLENSCLNFKEPGAAGRREDAASILGNLNWKPQNIDELVAFHIALNLDEIENIDSWLAPHEKDAAIPVLEAACGYLDKYEREYIANALLAIRDPMEYARRKRQEEEKKMQEKQEEAEREEHYGDDMARAYRGT